MRSASGRLLLAQRREGAYFFVARKCDDVIIRIPSKDHAGLHFVQTSFGLDGNLPRPGFLLPKIQFSVE